MQPRTRETTDTMMDMDMTDAAVAVAAVRDMADDATESSSDAGTGTAVLERPETSGRTQRDDGGDADRYAHYVSKNRIAESRLTGRPVVALCGKIWVPKHDPDKYPVCPDCKRIYEEMMF